MAFTINVKVAVIFCCGSSADFYCALCHYEMDCADL